MYAIAAIFDGTIAISASSFMTVVERFSGVFSIVYVMLYPSFIFGFSFANFAIAIDGNPSGVDIFISLDAIGFTDSELSSVVWLQPTKNVAPKTTNNIIDLKVLLKQNSLKGIYYVILHNDTFRIFEKLIITDGTKVQ